MSRKALFILAAAAGLAGCDNSAEHITSADDNPEVEYQPIPGVYRLVTIDDTIPTELQPAPRASTDLVVIFIEYRLYPDNEWEHFTYISPRSQKHNPDAYSFGHQWGEYEVFGDSIAIHFEVEELDYHEIRKGILTEEGMILFALRLQRTYRYKYVRIGDLPQPECCTFNWRPPWQEQQTRS